MGNPLPATTAEWIYWGVTLAIVAATAGAGDRPERLGSLIVLTSFILSALTQFMVVGVAQLGILGVDTLQTVAFAGLALITPRWWPRMAAAFAFLTVIAHLIAIPLSQEWAWAYVMMQWVVSAGLLLSLVAALIELPFARAYAAWEAGETVRTQ